MKERVYDLLALRQAKVRGSSKKERSLRSPSLIIVYTLLFSVSKAIARVRESRHWKWKIPWDKRENIG